MGGAQSPFLPRVLSPPAAGISSESPLFRKYLHGWRSDLHRGRATSGGKRRFSSSLEIGGSVATPMGVFRGSPLPAETQLKCILGPDQVPVVGAVGLQDNFSSNP